jgi:4'-phosphopantetheinyl transferase EntD
VSTVPLLSWLLPAEVARSERFGEADEPAGLPAERAAIAHAVASRRRDYLGVRDCAREAFGALGAPPAPIGTGPRREPLWPPGLVGSLTHCAGYRAAAVAHTGQVRSVGIDAEPHEPLPPGVLDLVALDEERASLGAVGAATDVMVHADRVLFCAKEAVYKAWYPLTGEWLGFEEACVRIEVTALDPVRGRFGARLLRSAIALDGTPLSSFDGRWVAAGGFAAASVVVPAGPASAGF